MELYDLHQLLEIPGPPALCLIHSLMAYDVGSLAAKYK